jgi:transmembrane sensor
MRKPDIKIRRLLEASDWVQRLNESPDDERTLSAWLEWCSRSPVHLDAFEQMQRVWFGFGSFEQVSSPTAAPTTQGRTWAQSGRPRRSHRFALGMAAGVALTVTTAIWWTLYPGDPVYRTEVGEQRSTLLPDGSHLDIGGGSKVTVHYTDVRREVRLERGEAYFTVVHNPQRPFVVAAGGVHVIAVGTAFDVRRGIEDTVVTVSQGRVHIAADGDAQAVYRAAAPIQAEAGQRVVYSEPAHSLQVASIDPKSADAWRNGVFDFVAEPLSEVVQEVNRYSSRHITIGDAALGRRLFTGTVHQSGVDEWLKALEAVFPLTAVDRGANGIELVPRKGAGKDGVAAVS